uniref:nucleoside-diphosphate kinase n=1 Tax=Felis catus TaxID=9685 RepID=A0ABI7XQW4_FELCA
MSPPQLRELQLVAAMVWEGLDVVWSSRALIGHSDSAETAPDTIRGDFSIHISHTSDSMEGAQTEIQLWFQSSELVDWADEVNHLLFSAMSEVTMKTLWKVVRV